MAVERVLLSQAILKIECAHAGKWLYILPIYIKCSTRIQLPIKFMRDSWIFKLFPALSMFFNPAHLWILDTFCLRTSADKDFQTHNSSLPCQPKKRDILLNVINFFFPSVDFSSPDLKTWERWGLCLKEWRVRKTQWGWMIHWNLPLIQDKLTLV